MLPMLPLPRSQGLWSWSRSGMLSDDQKPAPSEVEGCPDAECPC